MYVYIYIYNVYIYIYTYMYIYANLCIYIQKRMRNPSLPWLRSHSTTMLCPDNCCPAPPGEQSGTSDPVDGQSQLPAWLTALRIMG